MARATDMRDREKWLARIVARWDAASDRVGEAMAMTSSCWVRGWAAAYRKYRSGM